MGQVFANVARAKLAQSTSAGDDRLYIGDGFALFPVATLGTGTAVLEPLTPTWFRAVLQDDTGYEIVLVRRSESIENPYVPHVKGEFANVLRGQEGTTPRDFEAGATISLRPTAGDMKDMHTYLFSADSNARDALNAALNASRRADQAAQAAVVATYARTPWWATPPNSICAVWPDADPQSLLTAMNLAGSPLVRHNYFPSTARLVAFRTPLGGRPLAARHVRFLANGSGAGRIKFALYRLDSFALTRVATAQSINAVAGKLGAAALDWDDSAQQLQSGQWYMGAVIGSSTSDWHLVSALPVANVGGDGHYIMNDLRYASNHHYDWQRLFDAHLCPPFWEFQVSGGAFPASQSLTAVQMARQWQGGYPALFLTE